MEQIQKYFKRILSGEIGLDTKIGSKLDEMQANLEDSFISEYEIAAQNVIDWSLQSRAIDFIFKRKKYFNRFTYYRYLLL